MAAESGQEYAERPKEGELWHQMIERQLREGNTENGYLRELLRSLPDEKKQDKERGNLSPSNPLMAESFDEMLRQASQRAVPDHSQELER